jgi:hypothetical protein
LNGTRNPTLRWIVKSLPRTFTGACVDNIFSV